jgi:hypothetical protein
VPTTTATTSATMLTTLTTFSTPAPCGVEGACYEIVAHRTAYAIATTAPRAARAAVGE